MLAPDSSVRVIDLGGGTGAFSEVITVGSGEVVILEPSRRKVEAGRRRRPSIAFVQGRAERIPFGDRHFDRVMSIMAYHHFQDPDQVLAEAQRVLAPGGRVVVCDLDPMAAPGQRASWFERVVLRRRFRFESPAQLARRLERRGLTVRRVDSVGATYILVAD